MTPDEFRKIRKAARMTQAQMAERLDVSRKTVVNWENGVFQIPDNALDTLTERGVAPAPSPARIIDFKTHPELYKFEGKRVFRLPTHPHWFARCTMLAYHMLDEIVTACEAMRTTEDDLGKLEWTPERAIAFIMQFDRPDRRTRMSRERAEDIAREVGFAVAPRPAQTRIRHENAWLIAHGTMAGFYDAHPQYPNPAPPARTWSPDEIPSIGELDNFTFPKET